jgi:TonB family protein
MYQFLAKNILYPTAASKANVSGRVFLSFVITETGDVEDIQVLKGIGFGCDAEAIRVLKTFPKWIPGEQGGVPVNVKYNLPINFQIEDGNSKTKSPEDEVQIPYFPPAPAKNQSDEAHIQIRTPDGPISAEDQPLYVVNGEVMEDGEFLKTMPANTISRINVLKGASASSLYGEPGKGGVVMITTKD